MRYLFLLALVFFLNFESTFSQSKNMSWEAIQKSGKGSVTVYWYDNDPFSYKDADGKLKGLEVEIMKGFQKFIRGLYKIELSIRWDQVKSFEEVLSRVKDESATGIFGFGGFSITEERKAFMKFSPSYMADITVLVSTADIPIVITKDDLGKYLVNATAIVIPGTTMEKDLRQLRDKEKLNFNMEYVSNSFDFLSAMKERKKSFGYLSLPVYLMNLNHGMTNLKRQNYFTQKKEGHGIGFPKTSDWDVPMNAYFASSEFKKNHESIIANYINIDLYNFIKEFTSQNDVGLLNKEKDIQQMEIKLQNMVIAKDGERQRLLVFVIIVVTGFLISVTVLFRNQLRDHRVLKEQKDEIEAQSDEIKSINDNLEVIVQERTRDLQNKNRALEEYAHITAHNLSAPLANILEAVSLFDAISVQTEDKIIVTHLKHSAKNLDLVISSITDAPDENKSIV